MKRWVLATAILVAACSHKKDAGDAKFDQKWSELTAKEGAEPAFIEGDLHGTGLMGRVPVAEPTTTALEVALLRPALVKLMVMVSFLL